MLLSIKQIKKLYSISRISLLNWEKKGLIKPAKTPGGHRRYKKEDIEKLLNMKEEKEYEKKN